MLSDGWQFIGRKDWEIYPFIPPLFSLFLSFILIPIYEKLFNSKLESYLELRGMRDKFMIIAAIAQGRGLQIAYLSGIPSFLISAIAASKSDHPRMLVAVILLALLVGLPISLFVFLEKNPGDHAMTYLPNTLMYRPLFSKRNWTYSKLYARTLSLLNVLLIAIIIYVLPEKQTP